MILEHRKKLFFMLILTRKVGESIILAGKVRVQVLSLKGTQVRIGISAPDEVRVMREELFKAPSPIGVSTRS